VESNDWYVQVSFAPPTHYYVAIKGDDSNEGSEAHPWRTIQHALDNVPDSGTIRVNSGTYQESIAFSYNKLITLESVEGRDKTVILGVEGSPTITIDYCLGKEPL